MGVTSIDIKESLADLSERLRQAETHTAKERLQVLYWLKQAPAPSISAIAKAVGQHRNTVQTWLALYQEGGVAGLLSVKPSSGGARKLPQWAETALAKRLEDPNHGFKSDGEVPPWLAETLDVEAQYHAVYQMPRYRLRAQLKVARPQHRKQNQKPREAVQKTW